MNPEMLVRAFQGAPIVLAALGKNTRGQTRAGINGTILKELLLPVPPRAEQDAMLVTLGVAIDAVESLRQTKGELEMNLSTLNSSVLAKAFRGELVPQDPSDEPASDLLERIRREREGGVAKKKVRTAKQRAKNG